MKTVTHYILDMNDIDFAVRDYVSYLDGECDADGIKSTFTFCDSDGNQIKAIDDKGKPISINAICVGATVEDDD